MSCLGFYSHVRCVLRLFRPHSPHIHVIQVLHVRSVSSWAPVCIGPYCQANTLGPAGAIALIAGQIGLQPATMVLPPRPPGPIPVLTTKTAGAGNDNDSGRDRNGCGSGGDGGHEGVPSSFHGPELELSVSHASSVASAVGASVSRGCVFATLYVSEEAAIAAAAANKSEAQEATTLNEEGRNREKEGEGDWLQNLVEDCRRRIEGWFSREYAEAVAEAAGTGAAGPGVEGDEGEDSAEEGWTSDPEELAKEAARKRVRTCLDEDSDGFNSLCFCGALRMASPFGRKERSWTFAKFSRGSFVATSNVASSVNIIRACHLRFPPPFGSQYCNLLSYICCSLPLLECTLFVLSTYT